LHKSTHIENIRNVSRQISGECDGFHGKWLLKVLLIQVTEGDASPPVNI
jgi:hypothetical protein